MATVERMKSISSRRTQRSALRIVPLSAQLLAFAALLVAMVALTGCGGNISPTAPTAPVAPVPIPENGSCGKINNTSPAQPAATANYAGAAFTGSVKAGQLAVIGSSVQVYAAGNAGNGSAPTALLTAPLTTDANGSFSVSVGYSCPYNNSVVYAVATGGKAGASGTANAGIKFASVLGQCSSISGTPAFTLNEATTVTTAYAMSQFFTGENMGATATNSSGIGLAAATVASLVNINTGAVPGAAFPATGTAPVSRINTLANLLNACTVSAGASSSACAQLYSLTATGLSSSPSDTLGAAVNLVKHPSVNVSALYTQSAAGTAYSPSLAGAPSDWTLFTTFSGGGMNDPSALAVDSTGKIWVANYFSVASYFSNTGTPIFPNGYAGYGLQASYGGAVDVNDFFSQSNEQSDYSLSSGLGSLTIINSTGTLGIYGGGGMNFPLAVANDPSSFIWVVDYGDSTISLFSTYNVPATTAPHGYTAKNLVFPVAIATDAKCNAYVANQASNTVTRISQDGSTFTDFVVGEGPSGVAVDSAGNAWSANFYDNSVGYIESVGLVGSSGGFTGGGLDRPQGIAADGAGNIWVANYRAPGLTEVAGASATTPGAVLSPSTGWAPDAALLEAFGLAIDASGNIWVSNFGSNTITEYVGIAGPVQTPLIGPVRIP